jgi:hypothetical protein
MIRPNEEARNHCLLGARQSADRRTAVAQTELVTAVARKVWNGDKSKRPRYHRPAKKFQNEPSASTVGQNRPRPIIRLCE